MTKLEGGPARGLPTISGLAFLALLLSGYRPMLPQTPPAKAERFLFREIRKENAIYRSVTHNVSGQDVEVEGSPEGLARFRASGFSLPLHVTADQLRVFVIETGSKEDDEQIPFTGRLDSAVSEQRINGQVRVPTRPTPFDSTFRMWGAFRPAGIRLDSAKAANLDPTVAAMFKQAASQMMSSTAFPDSPLAVGDTFSQAVPLAFGMPGASSLQLLITSTYTLRELDATRGSFDVVQTFELAGNPSDGEVKMTGSGSGTLIFDRARGHIAFMNSAWSYKSTLTMGDLRISSAGNGSSEQSTTLEIKR